MRKTDLPSHNITTRRLAAVLAAVMFMLSMASCSKSSDSETTVETTIAVTSTPTPTPLPTDTPTPTPSPTPSPSPTPVPRYVEPQFSETWYNGFVDARSVYAESIEDPTDIAVLVNKYYALDADYVPPDLVSVPHSGNQQLRQEACDAYLEMYEACLEATGQGLYLVSGYRDYNTQSYLFTRSTNLRGIEFSVRKNAVAGRSEHQLGLALDITPEGVYEILDEFGETRTGIWVNEHCHEFGFVRRFKYEYRYITGYDQEAWHYRYLGVELATYLYENDMTLEEYYGCPQIMPGDE